MKKKLVVNCEKNFFSQFILLKYLPKILDILLDYFCFSQLFLVINVVDRNTMQKLNNKYYPFKSISSVLAFPFVKISETPNAFLPLGEIYFCYPLLLEKFFINHHEDIKVAIKIFLHSFLHLLGHQHFDKLETNFMENTTQELQKLIYQKVLNNDEKK